MFSGFFSFDSKLLDTDSNPDRGHYYPTNTGRNRVEVIIDDTTLSRALDQVIIWDYVPRALRPWIGNS